MQGRARTHRANLGANAYARPRFRFHRLHWFAGLVVAGLATDAVATMDNTGRLVLEGGFVGGPVGGTTTSNVNGIFQTQGIRFAKTAVIPAG